MYNLLTLLFLFNFCQLFGQNWTPQIYTLQKDSLPYQLYKPKTSNEKIPLLIFLHGAGERGNDNKSQLTHTKYFTKNPYVNLYPCYILAPQCPLNKKWVNVDWGSFSHEMPKNPSKQMEMLLNLIKIVIKRENIDKSRIYIVGLSMGGYGVWDAISREPDLFTAAVPICGGGDLNQAKKLIKMPIWAFHGSKDKVVPPQRSINMIDAIQKLNGIAKLKMFETAGHDAWNPTLSAPEVYQWLFEQKSIKN